MREKDDILATFQHRWTTRHFLRGGTSEGKVYGIRLMGIDGETADICKNKE